MLFPKIATGFDLIDNLWQGFFKGRTYLVTGPSNSGKTIFCLQFAAKGLAAKEKVIFFTPERAEDVLLRAEGLQFNIQPSAIENKQFLIFQLSKDISPLSDAILIKTMDEIIQIIEQERPSRLVFDPITPLLQFENFSTLKRKITELIYTWEKFGATSVITLGEPANQKAEQIFDLLSSIVTATIKLTQNLPDKIRTLTLQARLGHYPDFYTTNIKIESGLGLMPVTPVTAEPIETTPSLVTVKETVVEEAKKTIESVELQKEEPTQKVLSAQRGMPQAVDEEAIPEFPVRDLDRDDFTGLYNFDGLLHIINQALEKKNNFALILVWIISGVESRAKRLLLSQKLAQAVKNNIAKPLPVGRYSDKIIVLLNRTTKSEVEVLAKDLKAKTLKTLVRENDSLANIDIQIEVYAHPEDIRTLRDVETIVGIHPELGA